MSRIIEGQVVLARFCPYSAHEVVLVLEDGVSPDLVEVQLSLVGPPSAVTVEGKPADRAALLAWLADVRFADPRDPQPWGRFVDDEDRYVRVKEAAFTVRAGKAEAS